MITKIHILLFNSTSRNFTLNKDYKKTTSKARTVKKIKTKVKESVLDSSSNKIENDIK